MRGRGYDCKIEIWGKTEVSDGFCGYVQEDVKIKSVWAAKETKGAGYKFQQFGLNDFQNPVIFRTRPITLNEDSFIKFKGRRFEIKGVEDVNLDALELNIYADET